jgi:hypothetical protein
VIPAPLITVQPNDAGGVKLPSIKSWEILTIIISPDTTPNGLSMVREAVGVVPVVKVPLWAIAANKVLVKRKFAIINVMTKITDLCNFFVFIFFVFMISEGNEPLVEIPGV